jgi:hypothetical protein
MVACRCDVYRVSASHDCVVKELRARTAQEQVAVDEGPESRRTAAGATTGTSGISSSSSGEKVPSKEGGEAASAGDVVAQVDAAAEAMATSHASEFDAMEVDVHTADLVNPSSSPAAEQRVGDVTGQRDEAVASVTAKAAGTGAMSRRDIFDQLQLSTLAVKEVSRKVKKGTGVAAAEDEASVDSQSRSLSSVSESESIDSKADRACGKRQREISGRGRNVKKSSNSGPVSECEESRGATFEHSDHVEVPPAPAGEMQHELSSGSGPAVDTCSASVSGEGTSGRDSEAQRADHFTNSEKESAAHSCGIQSSSDPSVAPVSAPDVASPAVTVKGAPNPEQPSSPDPVIAPVSASLPASATAATSGATPQSDGAQGVKRKLEAQIAGVLEAVGKLHGAPDSAVVKKMKTGLENRLERLSDALERIAAKEDAELLREAEQYL